MYKENDKTAPKPGLIKTEVNNSGSPKYLRPCSVNTVNTELTEISTKTLDKRAETCLGLRQGDRKVKQTLVVIFNFRNETRYSCSFYDNGQ